MSEIADCINSLSAKDIIRGAARTANGMPFYINALGLGTSFCAGYQAIYDSFATPPSAGVASAQNIMWCGLVDAGIAAKLDIFYLFAQSNGIDALINWANLGNFDALNVHNTLFTELEGFTGDGANDYINSQWQANTDGVNFAQNDASFGFYSRTNIGANGAEMGAWHVGNAYDLINAKNGAGNCAIYVNSTGPGSVANANASGMYITARLNATDQDIYRNKVKIIDSSGIASTGVPDIDMYFLAYNNNGVAAGFKTSQLSVGFAGSGFSQTDVDNMTDLIEAYMDSNGKGVI